MAQGKFILNIKAATKYLQAISGETTSEVSGGSNVTMPDGSVPSVGGALDSEGNPHTIEVWQLITCEDDGTGTGTNANFCRLFLCSDRFPVPSDM